MVTKTTAQMFSASSGIDSSVEQIDANNTNTSYTLTNLLTNVYLATDTPAAITLDVTSVPDGGRIAVYNRNTDATDITLTGGSYLTETTSTQTVSVNRGQILQIFRASGNFYGYAIVYEKPASALGLTVNGSTVIAEHQQFIHLLAGVSSLTLDTSQLQPGEWVEVYNRRNITIILTLTGKHALTVGGSTPNANMGSFQVARFKVVETGNQVVATVTDLLVS